MHDSIISKYLNFKAWGDKDQANWSVSQIPGFYRKDVLEPLRAHPNADTLAAWDVFIAMKNADVPDNDKWTQIEYPSLAFDRGCDDYSATPSMDKLAALKDLLKANPDHPNFKEMVSRLKELVADYRGHHEPGGAPAPVAAPPSADPNVTVTTQQQGDMTIITTHTNAPPVTPPPAQ